MDAWDRIARHVRDAASYVSLLRTQELPTLIVTALDAHALRRQHPDDAARDSDDQEEARIVSILLQLMENKWTLGSLSPDAQRLVDYAHDWASETLLALGVDNGGAQDEGDISATREMERALFTYCAHTGNDHSTEAITAIHEVLTSSSMDPSAISRVLETCAIELHDDARFMELLELVVSNEAISRGLLLHKDSTQTLRRRLLTRSSANSYEALLDTTPARVRVVIFASDLGVWSEQLDRWLFLVHEAPFVPVEELVGLSYDTKQYPAQLYAAFMDWTRLPSRRDFIRTTRSRSLVTTVSSHIRDADGGDAQAFGRSLLSFIPQSLLSRGCVVAWTPKKRSFVLQHVAKALTSNRNEAIEWMEFIGMVEHSEIVQCAMDTLLDENVMTTDWKNAVVLVGWFESLVHGTTSPRERRIIREIVEETATALRGSVSWESGLQWLQLNRSTAFASLTMTRLRLAWRWVLTWSVKAPAFPVSSALESVEYALRRFTATENPRRFQIELIATFLDDLQWVGRPHPKTWDAEKIQEWILKLVRLLPSSEDVPMQLSTAALSQQAEHRLAKMKADRRHEE